MKFRAAPAKEGAIWVRDAFATFGAQPLGFAALFALCALALTVLVSIPVAGEAMLVIVAPIGTLLFMIATRRSRDGLRPIPIVFTELYGGRDRFTELLKLGLAYLIGALAAMLLVGWVDGGAMSAFMATASDPKAAAGAAAAKFSDPRLHAGFWLRVAVGAMLAVPFWHAPALIFWGRQTFLKSLFFSSVAIWRNKAAFLVYGLVWVAVALVFAMLLGIIVGFAGQRGGTFLAMPLVLVFSTVIYASLWYTFAGCFAIEALPSRRDPVAKEPPP